MVTPFDSKMITAVKGQVIYPEWQVIEKGLSVTFTCPGKKKVYWVRENGKSIRGKIKQIYLTFYNVKQKDTGVYKCVGEFENKTKFEASAHLLVGGK